MRCSEAKWIENRQRWQITIQKNKERKTFMSSTYGIKGKIEAEKKADKWLECITNNHNICFNKFYRNFMQDKRDLTSEDSYIKHEQIGRLYLIPILKNKYMIDITEQEWQKCITAAYKKGLSKKTLKNIKGSITAFCKYARKCNISIKSPEFLEIPRNAYVKEKTILQPNNILILMNNDTTIQRKSIKHDFYIHAYRFIALSGLRRGELCALKNENIKDGIVYIAGSINSRNIETRGKNANAKRWFALHQFTEEIISKQNEMLKELGITSKYIFPNENGLQLDPNILYRNWYIYRGQHNIKCSLQELRHTFISIAKADVPEQLLKDAVGHSKAMDTFGIYGHNVKGEAERTADILNDVFSNILNDG